jgi:hypothetical protein
MSTTEIPFEQVADDLERAFLRDLAESSPDELLREVASEILAGNLTWGQALRSDIYGQAVEAACRPALDDPEAFGPHTLAEMDEALQGYLDQLAADGLVVTHRPTLEPPNPPPT